MNAISKKASIDSVVVVFMCLYTIFIYLIYVSDTIASINSLVLYAFVGTAALAILFKWKIELNSYLIWYFGFVILSMISILYSPKDSASIYNLIVVLGLAVAMSVVMTSKQRVELFMRCLVIGSVFLTIYLFISGKMDIDTDAGERLGNELTGNANSFASIYMIAACSSVYFIMANSYALKKALYLLALVLQMYALVLSGGRKYPIVPLLVWYFIFLNKKTKQGKKHVIIYTVLGCVSALIIYYFITNVPFLYDTIGNRFESLMEYVLGDAQTSDASTLERERMRQKAFELWSQSPIFGNGFEAFSQIGGFGVYSHCNYLEILCNQGIIGFLYYYGFWAYLLWNVYTKKAGSLFRLFAGGMLIALVIYDYGAISYNTPITQFFILSIAIYAKKAEDFT